MNKLLTMISAVALLTAIAGSAYSDQHEKTVFVTSVSFNANLGGLTGADDKCQAEAGGPFTLSSWNARADKSDDIILVHNTR